MPRGEYKNAAGKTIPGVTTIIGSSCGGWATEGLIYWAWGRGMEGVDYNDIRDEAANIGTIAHERIEAFLKNEEPVLWNHDQELVAQSDWPYESFLNWYTSSGIVEVEATETIMINEGMQIGGRLDAVVRMPGKRVLLDFKTGKNVYATSLIQTATYAFMYAQHCQPDYREIDEVVVLHINRDGEFRAIPFSQEEMLVGFSMFCTALKMYQDKKQLDKIFNKAKKLAPLTVRDTSHF